ncbi:MAG: molecular chaperone HtpG [Anaerolineaceae bacterium]|nr:molecular chaperone HtpG [Anaerolineaceae bacterium]
MSENNPQGAPIPFKAETRQLLNILIHSLYTEREIFLRELISNASDALSRLDFVTLTNREILEPERPLEIRIRPDKEAGMLVIEDSGIGMTRDELVENLGTIAHSGAKAFVDAAKDTERNLTDIIGQFGVGFYSAFMVADWIRVTSRSYQPEAAAAAWYATGEDTYTLEDAEKEHRGTEVQIKLKDDAQEFLDESRLRQIIKRHSDFVQYPIYLGDEEEPVNRQTALWRQNPREIDAEAYHEFYKQLTLDFSDPLTYTHMVTDAPAQMYAVLFVPGNPQNLVFSPRKEPGLKLYARKVLIQEFDTDLLPQYLNFIQGVVDSEDLPLNVSRETMQANRVKALLARLVTGKALDMLKDLGKNDPEKYAEFWKVYGGRLKEGVAVEPEDPEKLFPLLRFHTDQDPERWTSLDEYLERAGEDRKEIYYFLGEDPSAVRFSPHMDPFRKAKIEVLVLTDPVDPFMLLRMKEYEAHPFVNVADADLPEQEAEEPSKEPALEEAAAKSLLDQFKAVLGERVSDVRTTERLSDSPARLVDPEGALDQSMQRVYQMMDKQFELPKKVLELNPKHRIIAGLAHLPAGDPRFVLIAEQVYEDALLIEGLHPDPVSMVGRIQDLMTEILGKDEHE